MLGSSEGFEVFFRIFDLLPKLLETMCLKDNIGDDGWIRDVRFRYGEYILVFSKKPTIIDCDQ